MRLTSAWGKDLFFMCDKIFNSDFDFDLFRREEEKASRNYERALEKPNVNMEELERLLSKFETYRQAANLIDYLKGELT